MKKTKELFKLLIPVMLTTTLIAVIFASLALCLTYSHDHGNIDMNSAYAILFVTTMLAALLIPILFVISFKDLKITRTKRDLKLGKVASAFILIAVLAYSISDIIYMSPGAFQIWRFLRAIIAVVVAVFAVFEILPSKTKISKLTRNAVNVCVPIYTIMSILVLYFNPKHIPEYFKIVYIIAYSILTLFFLYDFKWRLVPTNPKAYTAISTMAFTLPTIISLTSIVGYIFKSGSFTRGKITVSIFEMILVLAFGIYALSKIFAVKVTVDYVVVESQKRLEAKKRRQQQKQAEEEAMLEASKASTDSKDNENISTSGSSTPAESEPSDK